MKKIQYFDTPLSEVPVDVRDVYELMGYGNHIPSPDIVGMVDEMLEELKTICRPHSGYILVEGEHVDRESIKIDNTILRPGKIITFALRGSEQYALFTATIGAEFDQWFSKLKAEDDIVKLFVSNTLGSVLAESVVSCLMARLEETARQEGLSVTNNYSPGYCDWLLVEQQKIFSLLPVSETRIKLTDSSLMLPIKSVSGIVGIGANVKKRAYSCAVCNMTNCIRNKKKKSSNKSVIQ